MNPNETSQASGTAPGVSSERYSSGPAANLRRDLIAPEPEPAGFTTSAQIEKIAAALATAQSQYKPLKATSTADAEKYTYNYADLAAVLDAVRPALNGQGIAILQGTSVVVRDQKTWLHVFTRLLHQSGQWIETQLRLPITDLAPQKFGGLMSYLRRYSLNAVAGVAAEDNDGADDEPQSRHTQQRTRGASRPASTPTTSSASAARSTEPAARSTAPSAGGTKAAPSATKTKADTRHEPLKGEGTGTISAADRALLFATAKRVGWNEKQVKVLLFSLFGYESTSQIKAGAQFNKLLNAIESPDQHGVFFEEDAPVYVRENDQNPVIEDVTEGM